MTQNKVSKFSEFVDTSKKCCIILIEKICREVFFPEFTLQENDERSKFHIPDRQPF